MQCCRLFLAGKPREVWSPINVSSLVEVSSMLSEELQAIYMSSFGRSISWSATVSFTMIDVGRASEEKFPHFVFIILSSIRGTMICYTLLVVVF
jgi:hypothetical protein